MILGDIAVITLVEGGKTQQICTGGASGGRAFMVPSHGGNVITAHAGGAFSNVVLFCQNIMVRNSCGEFNIGICQLAQGVGVRDNLSEDGLRKGVAPDNWRVQQRVRWEPDSPHAQTSSSITGGNCGKVGINSRNQVGREPRLSTRRRKSSRKWCTVGVNLMRWVARPRCKASYNRLKRPRLPGRAGATLRNSPMICCHLVMLRRRLWQRSLSRVQSLSCQCGGRAMVSETVLRSQPRMIFS